MPTDTPFAATEWPRSRVYVRESLRTGAWSQIPNLDCLTIVESAPETSQATFLHRAGTILMPGEASFEDIEPLDLLGWFVRVDLLPATADGEVDDAEPIKSFVMRFATEGRDIGGDASDDVAQPIAQTFTAVGLEDMLDQIVISGAFLYDRTLAADSPAVRVATPVPFNQLGRVGLNTLGNRSSERVSVPDLPAGLDAREAYAFDAVPRTDGAYSDVWSTADLIKYAFAFFVMLDVALGCVAYEGEGGEEVDPMATALSQIKPAALDVEGLTVRGILDTLLQPARGLGWRLRLTPGAFELSGPVPLQLHVYSLHNADVVLSVATIPANTDTIEIDAARGTDVMSCRLSEDHSDVYEEVTAVGESVLSCFTVSFADGTLEKDWTAAEEANYLSFNDPDYTPSEAEVFVDDDDLAHVFCRYRIPYDWDGLAGNGEGGVKSMVIPKLDNDGLLTTDRAGLIRVRRTLLDRLPLLSADRPDDAEFEAAGQRIYRPAFALLQFPNKTGATPARRYGYAEKMPQVSALDLDSADVYMSKSDKTHAISLTFHTPHLMANAEGWTTPNKTFINKHPVPAVYCYRELVATVCVRTDERLFASRVARAPGEGPIRRLKIEVPDAELWIVAPGTVTGLTGDGGLERYDGPRNVRDDSARLIDIARAAAAWYGKPRRGLVIEFAGAKVDVAPGVFIQSVLTTGETAVNLCASSVRYDFERRTTTIAATYRPIDFGGGQ